MALSRAVIGLFLFLRFLIAITAEDVPEADGTTSAPPAPLFQCLTNSRTKKEFLDDDTPEYSKSFRYSCLNDYNVKFIFDSVQYDNFFLWLSVSLEGAKPGDSIKIYEDGQDSKEIVLRPETGFLSSSSAWPMEAEVFVTVHNTTDSAPTVTITAKIVQLTLGDVDPKLNFNMSATIAPPLVAISDMKPNSVAQFKVLDQSGNLALSPVSYPTDAEMSRWMSYFLYDEQGKYLGNLFDYVSSPYTKSSSVRIFAAYQNVEETRNFLIVNTQKNLEQFNKSTNVWAYDIDEDGKRAAFSITLDARNGPVALTVVDRDVQEGQETGMQFLSKGSFSKELNGTLIAYTGAPIVNPNSLVNFNAENSASQLPQVFSAFATTFVLDEGIVTLEFSPNTDSFSKLRPGRSGFLSSFEYPHQTAVQYTSNAGFQGDPKGPFYDLIIEEAAGGPKAGYWIEVDGNEDEPLIFNVSTLGSARGRSFVLKVGENINQTEAVPSDGAIVYFRMEEVEETTQGPTTSTITPPLVAENSISCLGMQNLSNSLVTTKLELFSYQFEYSPANPECVAIFNVPSGYAIHFELFGEQLAEDEAMTVFWHKDSTWIVFKSEGGTIESDQTWPNQVALRTLVNSNTQNYFNLTVEAVKIDLIKGAAPKDVKSGQTALILDQEKDFPPFTAYVITSDTNVSISAVRAADGSIPAGAVSLYLYEGEGDTAVFKGMLYTLLRNGEYVSQKKKVTIYMASPEAVPDPCRIMIADYSNVKTFTTFEVFSPAISVNEQTFLLNATTGESAIAFNVPQGAFLLKNITFSRNNLTLTAYTGGAIKAKENKLNEYSSANGSFTALLDQQFFGTDTTFVLNGGSAVLTALVNANSDEWTTTPRNGRSGFFATSNYITSGSQATKTLRFNQDKNQEFNFQINVAAKDKNSQIQCQTFNNAEWSEWMNMTAQNAAYKGRGFAVRASQPQDAAAGVLINFNVAATETDPQTDCPRIDCNNTISTINMTNCGFRPTHGDFCVTRFTAPDGYAVRIRLNAIGIAENEFVDLMYNDLQNRISAVNGSIYSDATWLKNDVALHIKINDPTNNIVTLLVEQVKIESKKSTAMTVKGGDPALLLNQIDTFDPRNTYVIKSENTTGKVVLSAAFYPVDSMASGAASLFLYEGSGANAVLKGSILSLLSSGRTYVSTLTTVSIYMAHDVKIRTNPSQIVVNDYSNIAEFSSTITLWPISDASKFLLLAAKAQEKPVAFTFVDHPSYKSSCVLNSIAFEGTGYVEAHAGAPTNGDKYLLQLYSSKEDFGSTLNQDFPGIAKTFIVTGTAGLSFYIDSQNSSAWQSVARDKRKGFLMTPNYPFPGAMSDAYEVTVDGDKKLWKFDLNSPLGDMNSGMAVSTQDGSGRWSTALNGTLTAKEFTGYGLKVNLWRGDAKNSTGAFLRFRIDVNGAASIFSTLFVFLLTLYV